MVIVFAYIAGHSSEQGWVAVDLHKDGSECADRGESPDKVPQDLQEVLGSHGSAAD